MLDFLNTLFQSLAPLWEMSVTAAYAAAIIIVLRLLLKKRAPKQVLCLLWLVVFARLLIPVSMESPLSIVPDALPGHEQAQLPAETHGTPANGNPDALNQPQPPSQNQSKDDTVTPVISNPTVTVPEGAAPSVPTPEPPAPFPWQAVVAGVWLTGAVSMGAYALFSYFRLRRRLFDAIRARDGAWEHPAVDSPFILGILRPRIYLPAGLVGRPRKFILCHERAHLRRLDHIVKPVCWIALALHWFNPLVWAAFILMSRDIESACDEAVVRRLGSEVKADYSTTLLALATGRRAPSPCPLAFDEGDAKGRIQNVLGYRRPALWVIVVSAIAAVLAAVCLLTDPVAAQDPDGPEGDPEPGATASQAPEVNLADTLLDPWMKEVLDGERQFVSAYSQYNQGDGRTYGIHDLRTFYYGDNQYPDERVELGRLAIIDLDRDGVNEMVIWPEGDYEYLYSVVGYLILHRQGDEIYGYNPVYRAFGGLKSDGSFSWSNSAAWGGYATLSFGPGEVILHETTYHRPGENEIDQLYFVDGLKATESEFQDAVTDQVAKPDVTWYTYADGVLSARLPDGLELLGQSDSASDTGEAKLWLEGGEIPWLEWNGSATRLDGLITPAQFLYIVCRDFDGDGQDEAVVAWQINGFAQLDLYEWDSGQPVLADTYDTQQLLLRFNQNNVAGYNKDTRGLTVTYSHAEGDDYRHLVTGQTTLPEDFFNGFEHIRDGYTYVYANQFSGSYVDDNKAFRFDFEFYLADDTMRELNYVDTPLATPPYSQYADHYMVGRPVGQTGFTLTYDGAKWVMQEPNALTMDIQNGADQVPDAYAIYTAAPLDAPVVDLMNGLPEDPEEWYKVAELPDDMIWVFSRNYGAETLIRWDGNFFQPFSHTAHTPHCEMPQLKKLGGPDTYGPLAVISHVNSGTGCFGQELVVYDLDAAPAAVDYTHDWKPLAEDFNSSFSYQYDRDTRVLTCTYAGQTLVKTLTGDPSDGEDITRLSISGEQVYYSFDEANDGHFQLRLGVQAFVDGNVTSLFPVSVTWTLQFNGKGFDIVPGSCVLS